MRFDELLDNFLFEYKGFSINPESTLDATSFGAVTVMKAIVNLNKNKEEERICWCVTEEFNFF